MLITQPQLHPPVLFQAVELPFELIAALAEVKLARMINEREILFISSNLGKLSIHI